MANLTEDQQRAFADRMLEILDDDDTKAACTAADSGFDPTKRVTKLTPLKTTAGEMEKEQTKKKADLKQATANSVAATGAYYHEASNAAEALVSALGEGHALSEEIRKIRGGMENPAARGPKKTGDKPAS